MLYCTFRGERIPVQWWHGEVLNRFYAMDTETTLIVEEQTPDLIIAQVYDGDTVYIVKAKDIMGFLSVNLNEKTKIAFCNAPFDMAVIDKYVGSEIWYPFVERGQVLDVAILYRLVRLAQVGMVPEQYNLDKITFELMSERLDKNPLIRLTFAEGITDDHLVYAAKDAVATYHDAKSLIAQTFKAEEGDPHKCLGHRLQLMADIALHNMRQQRIYVDQERVRKLKKETEHNMMPMAVALVDMGYNPNIRGTTARYEHVIKPILEENGIDPIVTSTGHISQKSEFLMQLYDHPFVKNYLDFKSDQKLLSTFIKPLIKAGQYFYPNYNLLVATGRTSCRKPNIQQQPRKGGIRECIIPPEGYVFLGADYHYIELCTLAQWLYVMFGGEREMCKVINSGQDPHITTASLLLNKSPKNISDTERQMAKPLNFGIAGGLSPKAMRGYAKLQYGVDFTETEAQEWHERYLHVYPDVADYLQSRWSDVVFPCGRRRPKCAYTVAHNTPFQGLASDGIKRAMYTLHKENRLQQTLMIHDELVCLCPQTGDYNEQARYLSEKMVEGMQVECPNVLVKADGVVMDRWLKGAEPTFNDKFQLMVTTEENMKED